MNRTKAIFLWLGVLIATSTFGCAGRDPRMESEPPLSASATPPPTPAPAAAAIANLPPSRDEVREAITRVYREAVGIQVQSDQSFITGDFNGDGSQDLAVIVKPAREKIEEINSEVANWSIGDPHHPVTPILKTSAKAGPLPSPTPVKARPEESLLAVIHGQGRLGWRNPEARQSYLLKNLAGGKMEMLSPAAALSTVNGIRRFPRPRGEVVKKQLANEVGLLYWNGAEYAWHSLGSAPSSKGARK